MIMVVMMHMMVINMYLGKATGDSLENWNMHKFYAYIGHLQRMYQDILMDPRILVHPELK